MKQVARMWLIAVLLAALSLPAMAAERADKAPIFYQGYNIGSCTANASGIGKVTDTYMHYWDIAAQENRVADIIHVHYDLAERHIGSAWHTPKAATVEIRAPVGILIQARVCKV